MDTALAEEPARPLRQALRRARIEAAERGQSVADLRAAAFVRLDVLREALLPVFREIAASTDLFDPALVPGDPPRLFIDLVAFVDIARDQRTYRFVRDNHAGRQILMEDADVARIASAVTDYVARRIVEREQLLAGHAPAAPASSPPVDQGQDRRRFAIGLAFATGLLLGLGAAAIFLWP